ncbi:ATP-binding cassette domain-containing protein, partial [bacterium]|nr:ATP-binding cassette domain-containing protein [bacterium]
SQEEIFSACQKADIHDFILSLPEGYNTLVGERGQKLSGGQKQRLSIARALLSESPIVILDEATSAVDNVTEAKVQRALESELKGKTHLVIAHRLSTVVRCDRIVVIKNGKIVEEGSHSELITKAGLYHSLWAVQTGNLQENSKV